jgi:prevent-host-death family protein
MKMNVSAQVTIAATELRNNFGNVLKRVYGGKEHLVVEKGGIPVAALIGIREYEVFRQWLAQELQQSLGSAMSEQAERLGLDEAGLVQALKEDRTALYQDLYGEWAANYSGSHWHQRAVKRCYLATMAVCWGQVEDIPVALSVIAAKVDYFVTLDRDFTDNSPTTRQIQDVMPKIMLLVLFLRKVMNWSSQQLEAIRYRSWSDFANETTE